MKFVVILSFIGLATAIPRQEKASALLSTPTDLTEHEASVFEDIVSSGIAQIVEFTSSDSIDSVVMKSGADSPHLPVVQMHGMGDFAANPMGMVPLKNAISKRLNGTYVTNVALASNVVEDMLSSFLQIMDKEIDNFAKAVQADANLAGGFNAIGYSQGGLIIRGYIEKYNNPPVNTFISVHGILMGVAGFPHCNYSSSICKMFDNFLGAAAYNAISQNILAQADYLRDPLRIEQFLEHSIWMPYINNEKDANSTYTSNLASLKQMVCVKALEDTMVWPNESEWWGFYKDGSTTDLLEMENTPWYLNNTFGLKTLGDAGKITKLTTPGDHLQFDEAFLLGLVDKYLQ